MAAETHVNQFVIFLVSAVALGKCHEHTEFSTVSGHEVQSAATVHSYNYYKESGHSFSSPVRPAIIDMLLSAELLTMLAASAGHATQQGGMRISAPVTSDWD